MMKASRLFQNLKFTTPGLHVKWIHPKAKYKLKDEIEQLIESKQIKPRKHPGIIKRAMVELPKWTVKAMDQSLDDAERPQLFRESKQLANYLYSRRLPTENDVIKNKYSKHEERILGEDIETMSEEELVQRRKIIKGEVRALVRKEVYGWKALEYNKFKSLMYMVARSAPEYAVMHSIFDEIKLRDPEFDPQTMFDFGSGVGTVLWAALKHWRNIKEYVGIDISPDMNNLSEEIMKHSPRKVKGVFRRSYMPVSNLKHDITVSAYSLMELPDMKSRLEVIAKMWKKTNNYLIIVEQGSKAGFQVIDEARSFIQHVMSNIETSYDYFIFAPCPHEKPCPRRTGDHVIPCNFVIKNATLPLLGPSGPHHELYTYVVFKKGKRTEKDNWHRLIRPTLVRSKHARCRTCTPEGLFEEIVFTPRKNGKPCYRCARKSRWGDRLPIDYIKRDENGNVEASTIDELSETEESDIDEELKDEEFEDEDELESEELKNEEKPQNETIAEKENSASEKVTEIKNEDEVIISKTPFEVLNKNKQS